MDYQVRNSTLYPHNITIEDCREAIKGVPGFRESLKGGIVCFNYDFTTRQSFPSPKAHEHNPKVAFHLKVRRECRGILFEQSTGRLVCRKFHKFFNINELEETHQDLIDIKQPYIILEKLDGSLIAPIYVNDTVTWGSKSGQTELSVKVDKYIDTQKETKKYNEFAEYWLKKGYTPMFEWCSESQRIVLYYAADLLSLTALRCMKTGEYLEYDEMIESAKQFNLPFTGKIDKNSMETLKNCNNAASLLNEVQKMKDIEGFILRIGHNMYKMKCNWYFEYSKSSSINLNHEKDIWLLILEKKLDDTISHLFTLGPLPIRYQKMSTFAVELYSAIEATSARIIDNLIEYRKAGKLRKHIQQEPSIPSFEKKMMFFLYDEELDDLVNQKHKMTLNIISLIKTNCSSAPKLEEARKWIGGIKYVD